VFFIGYFLFQVPAGSPALRPYLQVAGICTAESFPTRARPSGFSLSDGLGRGGGALVPATAVSLVAFFTAFAGMGVTGAIAALIAFLGPQAGGRLLEQVSR
jgi:putative MFS transporter